MVINICNFIDDYLLVPKKYLADITPYSHVKCWQTDNGTNFTSELFQRLLVLNRIKYERSPPYSLHQNGTAEWSWQTLFSKAGCLIKSKPPKTVWVYTLMASVYIGNRCYNKNTRKTRYESFTDSKPNLNKMHIFVMYKIKRNWILVMKKAFLSDMINKVQITWFIFRKQ